MCLKSRAYPICKVCIKNPFNIEKCRQFLAESRDFFALKNLYKDSLPEIINVNTENFWDEKFIKTHRLKDQDGLTKDRIKTTVSYIPSDVVKILDVGVGYGFFEEQFYSLTKKGISIYGFDISSKAVTSLNERFGNNFKVGSIYNPPFKKFAFDAIVALEILEHIPPKKIFNVLEKLRNLLAETGLLIISVPLNENLESRRDNPSGHVREYTKSLIFAELKLSKFSVLDYKEFYAFKNFYSFKKIIQKFLLIKAWEPNDIVIKVEKL